MRRKRADVVRNLWILSKKWELKIEIAKEAMVKTHALLRFSDRAAKCWLTSHISEWKLINIQYWDWNCVFGYLSLSLLQFSSLLCAYKNMKSKINTQTIEFYWQFQPGYIFFTVFTLRYLRLINVCHTCIKLPKMNH